MHRLGTFLLLTGLTMSVTTGIALASSDTDGAGKKAAAEPAKEGLLLPFMGPKNTDIGDF